MIPRATMRLQFHRGFTFADAERLVPYFARLGVSHIYASPITTARADSMHGYDVIDPTRVNPELGGEKALNSLVVALRAAGLGLIIDIVPNHMAADGANAWWVDVLRHGQTSRYAGYFDIDWNAEALRGKALLPVLGKPLPEALDAGELRVDGNEIYYFDKRFPLRPDSDMQLPLADLLASQHYRLAWWRIANDEINWRRFFDINELVAMRMEHAPAFDDAHALVFRLYTEGLIDGVRVDHVDGLSDPASYCRQLRQRLDALTEQRPISAAGGPPYIVVEKILLGDETLPAYWSCDGTSGYDFMNDVSAVQHDVAAAKTLDNLWEAVSGRTADFDVEEQAARREIIARSFSAQLEACAVSFYRLAQLENIELSRASLRRALIELLAHFPIYRTYATAVEHPARDRTFLEAAVAGAKATCLPADRTIVDRLAAWMSERTGDESAARLQSRAVTQFQQLSAPIAAKAVEDTAFYRYGRLLSRNDVGSDAGCLGISAGEFHARVLRRQVDFPHAMLATATHDHKRGEDVRARLAVLSERADEWARVLPDWIARCEPLRHQAGGAPLPHAGDVAMLFQTIVGAWPLDLDVGDAEGCCALAERLAQWQEKALREAKLATDWTVPNDECESAVRQLITSLMADNALPDLLKDIATFAQCVCAAGAVNGLAQTLLKSTVPGVPDFYQGTEFWDFSLVDPDNRRPVDFAAREQGLRQSSLADLTQQWRDGRIKQAMIARTLSLRRAHPSLFSERSYQPLTVRGAFADRVIAFARRHQGDVAVVIVPRVASSLLHQDGQITFATEAWRDTTVDCTNGDSLTNLFDSRARFVSPISVGYALRDFPVALLVSSRIAESL